MLLILRWNVTWTCFLWGSPIHDHVEWMYSWRRAIWWWFCTCKCGGVMRWLFNGKEISYLIWYDRAFLIYSHQKKNGNKDIASHYVFWLLFSYALHLCVSWRISAKLSCYLGSPPLSTPFPLHFSHLVFNLSPAVVEMIECGERNVFLFALLSLIQNLFLLDVPCVSKGFNTAQLCEVSLLS